MPKLSVLVIFLTLCLTQSGNSAEIVREFNPAMGCFFKIKLNETFRNLANLEKIPDWQAEYWLNSKTSKLFCYQEYYSQQRKFRE